MYTNFGQIFAKMSNQTYPDFDKLKKKNAKILEKFWEKF